MNVLKFKYRLDKTCRIVTWSVAGALALTGGALWLFSPGAYLPVWFAGVATALATLAALSIPRQIRLTDQALEIRCTVEITHIPWGHIRDAKRVEKSDFGVLVPVFASSGFFGWFGYWLAPRTWDFVKVYASSWRGLVMVEDIYEQKYVVSADDPAALLAAIEERRGALEKPKTRGRKKKKSPIQSGNEFDFS